MLGKLPAVQDSRNLQFKKYLKTPAVTPPAARGWHVGIDNWSLGGNDRFGNCVIVAAANLILCWRSNAIDANKPISDTAIIELSREMGALDGYAILDRLKWWRKKSMWADEIWAFAQIDPHSTEEIKIVINEFGACDLGLQMPRAWQKQEIWTAGDGPSFYANSWGGHSVPVVGYDSEYCYLATWGAIQRITWEALQIYCDEAYVIIAPDWLASLGLTPSGLDLSALHADLMALDSGV
jgi:hypothetical protein